jgi:excisionase family DNA binding protein
MAFNTEKMAYSIREFEQAVGVSHSTTYELIAAGELRTFNIGRRRFVSADALRDFIRRREAAVA